MNRIRFAASLERAHDALASASAGESRLCRRRPTRAARGWRAVACRAGALAAGIALLSGVAACGAQSTGSSRRAGDAQATSATIAVAPGGSTGGSQSTSATGAGSQAASATAAGTSAATFTLLDGRRESLAQLRGRPLLLWFIASGCASCAVSIPAVGQHLSAFSRAHVRILLVGIYGSFGSGPGVLSSLRSFGHAAAGANFSNRVWSWGLASAPLTERFDPGGVPDRYFLLDRSGRVVFQDSTPVWTLRSLLDHLKEVA